MAASYGRPSVGGRSGAGDNNKNASYGLWVLRASTLPETPRASPEGPQNQLLFDSLMV